MNQEALKCQVTVMAGVVPGEPINKLTRSWSLTQWDLDNPPIYIDRMGAAMNYAMSLQNPATVNWVRFEWIWM